MFSGQRDFCGIIFSCSLRASEELIMLFGEPVEFETSELHDSFQVCHGFYYSVETFAAPETIAEIQVKYQRKQCYKYDFYIVQWAKGNVGSFLILVPFSKMAAKIFSSLHEATKEERRRYSVLNLVDTIETLRQNTEFSSRTCATEIKFRLDGGDSVNGINFAGQNVTGSRTYQQLTKSLGKYELVPRRIRLRFQGECGQIVLGSDTFGNFRIRVRKSGSNLPLLAELIPLLEDSNLLVKDGKFPLRSGVLQEIESD